MVRGRLQHAELAPPLRHGIGEHAVEADGGDDAGPDPPNLCASFGAHEVGDEDGHHEGGFEAFAQADQEAGEHGMDDSREEVEVRHPLPMRL